MPTQNSKGIISVVTGVAKKEPAAKPARQSKQKGELMENDQDAMEVSLGAKRPRANGPSQVERCHVHQSPKLLTYFTHGMYVC